MVVVALLIAACTAGSASLADEYHGKVPADLAPVDDALAAAQRVHPGRVLKVELEREDDGAAAWVYEVKLLTHGGHVLEVKLNAVSLEVIGIEGEGS